VSLVQGIRATLRVLSQRGISGMDMVRAGHGPGFGRPITACACQSPVCPEDHGPTWTPSADSSVIGLAVGVRRVVTMPVPRLRRRFSLGWPVQLRRS
jgi:hypothetical protein